MNFKRIFILSSFIFILMFSFSNSEAQSTDCKCGKDCKCPTENNSGCKCGKNCKCKTTHKSHHDNNHTSSQNIFLMIMDTMMVKMDAVPLTSSIERNFLEQMIYHHQGAVDMARYEIEHGNDFEMIQLAKSILAEQRSEIIDMEALLQNYQATGDSVTQSYKKAMDKTMSDMMKNTPSDKQLPGNIDCCFAMVMLPHHQAAVDMAAALLKFYPAEQISAYALKIISDQQIEIEQMTNFTNYKCK